MKKFIFLLVIAFTVPFFAVSVSASEYPLDSPVPLTYIKTSGRSYSSFAYFNDYHFYSYDGNLIFSGSSSGFPYIRYSEKIDSTDTVIFSFGSEVWGSTDLILSGYLGLDSQLAVKTTSNMRNHFTFASFVYENLLLPSSGQYLKVTIKFSSYQDVIPPQFSFLTNILDYCYLCDDYSAPGIGDSHSLPRLFPSSATVKSLGSNFYEYNFYFNYSGIDRNLFSSDNICLAIRIPYYFSDNQNYSNGVNVYSSAILPHSYEILTIGGYSDELNSIENSIVVGFSDLNSTLTNQIPSDITIIAQLDNQLNDLDNSMSDYDAALAPILTMKDSYTSPPMQSIVNQYTDSLDTSDVKSLFSLPWIVSAISLVFAFCIIRLLLYGTKEG